MKTIKLSREGKKGRGVAKFEEAGITARVKRWAVDLSDLRAFSTPCQEMEKVFTKEITISQRKGAPYFSFVVSKIRGKPSPAPSISQERANRNGRKSPLRKLWIAAKKSPVKPGYYIP